MQSHDHGHFGNDGVLATWVVIGVIVTAAYATIGALGFAAWQIANLFF